MMSRVEDIAPLEVRIGMRVKFRVHRGRGRRTALSRVHAGGGARHERPHARQRRDHRRRGIRHRRGRRQHEPARSDGAGHPPRAGRLRPDAEGRRWPVLRHHAGAHLGHVAMRVSTPAQRLYRLHHRRWLVVRGACRARAGRARGRAVFGGGDRLWQHATHRRPARGIGARIQPLRDAVPPVPARYRLRDGRIAPHARIRHHARTIGRGGGGRARMGAAQSGGVGEEAADHRGCAVGAADQLSVHGARLLPDHRWRRRHRHGVGRSRAQPGQAAGLRTRLRPGDHACVDFIDAGSDA